jgi:hypothetical protein
MDLLADYFGFRRGAPNNGLKPARSALYPFYHKGGKIPRGLTYHLKAPQVYWLAYMAADPAFGEWMRSPAAMVSPREWFDGIPFPEHLTPNVFANDFLPPSARGRRSEVYGCRAYEVWLLDIKEGLHELAAYAHGWTLKPHEKDLAIRAAQELYLRPQFTAYALVDTSALPMPFSDRPYLERASYKHRLDYDPLSLTTRTFKRAVPDFANTPEKLLDICPPRTEVAGSSRYPTAFSHEDLDALRRGD